MSNSFSKLSIDFAQKNTITYIRKTTFVTWLMFICAIATSSFLISKLIHKQFILNKNSALVQQLQYQTRISNRNKVPEKPVSTLSFNEIQEINHIITELNTPWSDFLDAIEAINSDVAILAIEPNIQKHLIRIQAESKNNDQMLEFLGVLRQSEHFKNSLLIKYETNELDSNKPTRFTIETSWIKDQFK